MRYVGGLYVSVEVGASYQYNCSFIIVLYLLFINIIVVILPVRPNALFLFVNKLKVKIVLFKILKNLFFSIRQTGSTQQIILIKNIKLEILKIKIDRE